ncbi:MAG: cation transporter [Bacteroidales bacterium]|nr:cation transporter [Bacteroidales bacterium]
MKAIKICIVAIIALFTTISVTAQTTSSQPVAKTVMIKVYGNCESCQARIEGAMKIDGVSKANWDVASKLLTVTYHPEKITIKQIHQTVAAVGHDTNRFKADAKVYDNLPACCKYERRK